MLARVAAFLTAIVIPVLLVRPGQTVSLVLQRELYRLLEAAGLLTAGNSYWGQILGRNIPTHPDWLRAVVVAASWMIPAAAVLWAGLWLRRLASRGRPRRGGPGVVLRVAGMAVVFVLVVALVEPRLGGPVQRLCLWLADRAGTNYTIFGGAMPMRPGGPFEGHWAGPINWLYMRGPLIAAVLAGGASAHGLDVAARLVFTRRLSRGDCPACGYDRRDVLDADDQPPCPECGSGRAPVRCMPA